MPILLSGSGYKPAFSFSGTGTGSTRKNPSSRIAGFEPGKLEAGTIKPLCMPLLTLYKSGLAVYLRCRLRHRRAQEAAAMKAVSKVWDPASTNKREMRSSANKSGLAVSLRCRLRHQRVEEVAAMRVASKVWDPASKNKREMRSNLMRDERWEIRLNLMVPKIVCCFWWWSTMNWQWFKLMLRMILIVIIVDNELTMGGWWWIELMLRKKKIKVADGVGI